MPLPLDHSIRALQSDREWPALAILLSAGVLLVLWAFWFFAAPLARYETGTVVGMTRDRTYVANFPSTASAALLPGQMALLRWHDAGDEQQAGAATGYGRMGGVAAMVMLVDNSTVDGQISVELAPLDELPADLSFGAGPTGSAPIVAEVEVENLSPAQWVWRASGQWIDTPQVLLRPQSQ